MKKMGRSVRQRSMARRDALRDYRQRCFYSALQSAEVDSVGDASCKTLTNSSGRNEPKLVCHYFYYGAGTGRVTVNYFPEIYK